MLLLPGRKVVTRSPHRRVGYISCPWFQQSQIQYESLLERSFVHIALLAPNVRCIESQPFRMTLEDGTAYTPDFMLHGHHQYRLVVEVKPQVFVSRHQVKLDAARVMLAQGGYDFLILTDEDIQSGNRHDRAAVILRHARSHAMAAFADCYAERAAALAGAYPIATLAAEWGLAEHQVLGLVGRRVLAVGAGLTFDTIYPVNFQKEENHACVLGAAWLRGSDR